MTTIAVILVFRQGPCPCEIRLLFLVQRLVFSPRTRSLRLDQMSLTQFMRAEVVAAEFRVGPACAGEFL